jgi:purine-binding chemotaxis protein CheW
MPKAAKSRTAGKKIELAVIYVGDIVCGIETRLVKEINKHLSITPVPGAHECIRGVLNLRGQILTVIDLRERLGMAKLPLDPRMRIVVITDQSEDICLLVDGVSDVVTGEDKNLEPPPSNIDEVEGSFFSSILKMEDKLVAVLNIDEVTRCGADRSGIRQNKAGPGS